MEEALSSEEKINDPDLIQKKFRELVRTASPDVGTSESIFIICSDVAPSTKSS